MGRCKPLGSLNSLLSYAPQPSGAILFPCSPCFLHSSSSSASTVGHGSIPWMEVLGALIQIWRPEIADGCDISCLSIQQEIFSFHRLICLSLPFGLHLRGTNDSSSQFPLLPTASHSPSDGSKPFLHFSCRTPGSLSPSLILLIHSLLFSAKQSLANEEKHSVP